ncbi:MAG: HepT-like ribonuclease domain-containing protein [Alphaproteobacteria bacterium]
MAGMRDILIHAYDHVDLDQVWTAATDSVPALVEKLRSLAPKDTDT